MGGRRRADESDPHPRPLHDAVGRQYEPAAASVGDRGKGRRSRVRGVDQAAVGVALECLRAACGGRPAASAAARRPFVELVVAQRAHVEADRVGRRDGRLVVKPARDQGEAPTMSPAWTRMVRPGSVWRSRCVSSHATPPMPGRRKGRDASAGRSPRAAAAAPCRARPPAGPIVADVFTQARQPPRPPGSPPRRGELRMPGPSSETGC